MSSNSMERNAKICRIRWNSMVLFSEFREKLDSISCHVQCRKVSNIVEIDEEWSNSIAVQHARSLYNTSNSVDLSRICSDSTIATYRICSSSMECGQWSMVELCRARSNLVVQHVESARVRWNVANGAWSNSIKIDRTWSSNI